MMLHALAGLPRSGTTLLGNIIAQHPDVHVSGTSALPLCVEAVVNTLSNANEVQSDLANVNGAYQNYLAAFRGFAEGWYDNDDEEHVVDKGRGWIMWRDLLEQLYPGSTLIVCVRDPRDVVASVERQDRKTAVFNSPIGKTLYERADFLMKRDSMVGGPMRMIEDLIRRQTRGVVYVKYESLVAAPEDQVAKVHKAMGLADFAYDLENVVNIASDLDALYRNKYPHDGSGAVRPTGNHWSQVMDGQLAANIASVFPLYMQTFAYEL